MKLKKSVAQWVSLLMLGVVLIVVYKTFDNLSAIGSVIGRIFSILSPFVIGFAIAFLLYGPVHFFERLFGRCKRKWFAKLVRPLAVLVVYLLALAVIGVLFYIAVPALIRAITDFINQVPNYYKTVMTFIDEHSAEGGLLAGMDVKARLQKGFTALQDQLTLDRVLSYLGSVLQFTSSLVDILMAVIISVYMLLGRESLIAALKSLLRLFFKPRTIGGIGIYAHKISRIFYNYFYSQMIDALIVGVLATIGFLIVGLPSAPVLGMMQGLMNLIPYFGSLIGGVVCVLVALLSGNFYSALFVAVYILVMQQLDGNIIQPRIVGERVGLKPIYVLLGITLFGGLLGFWGVFLGAPFIAVIQLILTDIIHLNEGGKLAGPATEPSPPESMSTDPKE